jgi:hypothetical protein
VGGVVAFAAGFGLLSPIAAPATTPVRPLAAPAAASFDGDFPDPHIITVDNGYVAYSTNSGGVHVPTLTSPDLVTWTFAGDALPTVGAWARSVNIWAPSVIQRGAQYFLYYVAPDRASGRPCIGSAVAKSPTGPFVDDAKAPLICQVALGGSIDPAPVVDLDGTVFLTWKSDGTSTAPPQLWIQPLGFDGRSVALIAVPLLGADQGWEAGIVENPSMLYVDGHWWLMYSANRYAGPDYGTGLAECATILGPCGKPNGTPILTDFPAGAGAGGASVFVDHAGTLQVAFHAWRLDAVGYTTGGARRLFVAPVAHSAGGWRVDMGQHDPSGAFGDSLRGRATVGAASTTTGAVVATDDGAVELLGNITWAGSMAGKKLAAPVVGAAVTPTGHGYWLVARDGGVFSFGDAQFYGSTGGKRLNQPIVSITATPSGQGYWLAARDGGVFSFGDAEFQGSTGGKRLNQPIVTMTPTESGHGYWLIARDGGVFAFGDAGFAGSLGSTPLVAPIVSGARAASGYLLLGGDGGVFAFGGAPFPGSATPYTLAGPFVALATDPTGGGAAAISSLGIVVGLGSLSALGSGA